MNIYIKNNKNIYIAYSGGVDSSVLLFFLYKKNIRVTVLHFNHMMNKNSIAWEKHCKNICQKYNMLFIYKRVCVLKNKNSLEENARILRYEFFSEMIKERDSVLLMGHNKSDVTETFFINLFRGAGVKGLCSIAENKKYKHYFIHRPLLSFTKKEIFKFAIKNNIIWIHDDSNDNINFSRNFLRNVVINEIKKRWPQVENNIFRTCNIMNHIYNFLLQNFNIYKENYLNISEIKNKNTFEQVNIIMQWIRNNNQDMPSEKNLLLIIKDFVFSRIDANPIKIFKNYILRRYKNKIYILKNDKVKNNIIEKTFIWKNTNIPIFIEKIGLLKKESIKKNNIPQTLKIKFRNSKNSYKKIFQKYSIPLWERNKIPLLFDDNDIFFHLYK